MRELECTRARSSVSTSTSWGPVGLLGWCGAWTGDGSICVVSRVEETEIETGEWTNGVWQERNKETWDVSARG